MASALDSYNFEVLLQSCAKCGRQYPDRCKGTSGDRPTVAHAVRLAAAGYRWDRKNWRLEKLNVR